MSRSGISSPDELFLFTYRYCTGLLLTNVDKYRESLFKIFSTLQTGQRKTVRSQKTVKYY